jgi:sulfopyruvate decarboxylase TPP-binding subunit
MDQQSVQVIVETLKEQGIDLVVTLPEEPTYALTEAVRQDSFFTAVTVAGEGNGIAFCAGAALGGRRVAFVTGVAGLLVSSWALAQMGMVYGAPILILASYRGDFGDHSGIPGSQLLMFKQVAEPLLGALRVPYRVVNRILKRMIQEGSLLARIIVIPLLCY